MNKQKNTGNDTDLTSKRRRNLNQSITINVAVNKMLFAHVKAVCDVNTAMHMCRRFGDHIVGMYNLRLLNRTIMNSNDTTVTGEYTVALTEHSLEPLLRAMVPGPAMVQTLMYKQAGSRITHPDDMILQTAERVMRQAAKDAEKFASGIKGAEVVRGRRKRLPTTETEISYQSSSRHTPMMKKRKTKAQPEVTDEMIDKILTPRNCGPRRSTPHIIRKTPVRSSDTEKCLWLELIRLGASVGSVAVYFDVSPASVTSALRGYRWPAAAHHESLIREAVRTQATLGLAETYTDNQIVEIREHLTAKHGFNPERWDVAFGRTRHNTVTANKILRNQNNQSKDHNSNSGKVFRVPADCATAG
jgi:hypothetical protein